MTRRLAALCSVTLVFAATAALGQLPPPTVTQVSISKGDLKVTGSSVNGAVKYEADVSVNGVKQTSAASTQAQVTIPAGSLPANTPITVTMRAVDSQGTSSASSAPAATTTAPAAPTGMTYIAGRNKVTVSWQPAAGAASYMVTLSNGMSATTTATSHTFTGLPTATAFNCIAFSYNAAGSQSAASPVIVVRSANIAIE